MATLDRYGEPIEELEPARHHDCPGLIGDEDRPMPCPVCRKPTRDRILRQRLNDYLNPPRSA
jgi:hypothetical protein